MDPAEIVSLTTIGSATYAWFKLFAHLSDAKPIPHRRHRHH